MGNYSLKNITLGIGIGLVISSMINISAGSRELTVEEIKKEAGKHNLIVLAKEDILNSQTPTVAPDAAPAPAADALQDNTPEAQAGSGKIMVKVEAGMLSEDVANLLKEKGLIKDTKAFQKRLGELGKDDKLQIGSFELPKGSSYDDIIKILTR